MIPAPTLPYSWLSSGFFFNSHLTFCLGHQVHRPANNPSVFASPTEQGAPLQHTQGEHASLVGLRLSHDLIGLCLGGGH